MKELLADSLLHDPDFKTSLHKVLETVMKHRDKITQICPPKKEHVQSYNSLLHAFNQYRGMKLFLPYLGSGIGNGALVELADGSVKYDLISGIGVHFGHCHPKVISACLHAAVEDLAIQGNLMQNRSSIELSEVLLKSSGFDHIVLTTSGAMANENALKLIFQKKAPANRVLTFERCFIGRTLAMAQISDRAPFREGLPDTLRVDYIPFYDWKDPEGSTLRSLQSLEKLLKRYPGKYACMCFELIQGEGGVYPGAAEYFKAIMQKLKDHGVAILADEVQSFGRTDALFAFQSFGLQKYVDVVTVGKLLHACATLYKKEFAPKPGLISQTFTAATSSIYVAKAIVDSLLQEGYLGPNGKNLQIRNRFVSHLEKIATKYPQHFEGPYGMGLMIACTPFNGDREKVIAYGQALFEAGVIAFIAGAEPTRIRFLVPAGGITPQQIDHVAKILEEELVKCLNH